jgi:acetyl/propionyl-CoA carboxylase alpha subunit
VKWIEVEFQGKKHRLPAMKSQGRLWFHWKGENHVVDLSSGVRRGGGGATNLKPGMIAAPMPGKITKIWVGKGDKVSKGQALVVMEAMKMEYTLEADQDGKVEDIQASVGAQVTLGQLLVKLGAS